MKLEFLRRIWADIRQGHNVELYFTVLVCLVVIALSMFSIVDLKAVSSAILAVLSLQAVSLLTNRRAEQELRQSLDEIVKRQHQLRLSDVFFPFDERTRERRELFMQADEVWILSRTCEMIWHRYGKELQTIAQRGGLRLLFLDPSGGALDMLAKSDILHQPGDVERIKKGVMRFVDRLEHIQGTLQLTELAVRLIDYLPAWTLILINPRKNDGIIHVQLGSYRSGRPRPSFIVKRGVDSDLFNQFRTEFEEMWKDAQPAW